MEELMIKYVSMCEGINDCSDEFIEEKIMNGIEYFGGVSELMVYLEFHVNN